MLFREIIGIYHKKCYETKNYTYAVWQKEEADIADDF